MTETSFQSSSATETKRLGGRFARYLCPGDTVGLIGEIGSGKTTFIQGIAAGLKVKHPTEVTSPTFVLIHQYEGRIPLTHVDLYRIERVSEVEDLGLEEIGAPKGVTVVEWAEKLPADFHLTYRVTFESLGKLGRRISVHKKGIG